MVEVTYAEARTLLQLGRDVETQILGRWWVATGVEDLAGAVAYRTYDWNLDLIRGAAA